MNQREKVKLLHGPYTTPNLKRGDKATCLLRDTEVIITGMSDARIPWPRCRAVGKRGGSGLLLAGDLVRAVQSESAAAVMYWWGVTEGVVWRWRLALGVSGLEVEGSRRLRDRLNRALAADLKGKPAPGRPARPKPLKPCTRRFWTAAETALLGTVPDAEAAARTGRTLQAIYEKRCSLRIPSARRRGRPRGEHQGGHRP